ncbi:hypothetical protein [Lysinibacillus xylanilyticus]|uniref:Transcription initiation factor TFIIIB n=1 Tax=Lysinibacillus xylanilyticus TaxID=582475 RepID=A0ABT4ETP1_9BACI|nr:hypothetical protein [Lysinibacillus xylanilyticus]MCY9549039.1 hypothetical protein [Lysinibacillus xylanilyticus]MED3804761.1 hypothetical protein [Lysinibacillus xylanilyticus]
MGNIKLVCKACGSDSFTTGQVGGNSSHGNIRPIGSIMAFGSPFLMTFCKNCGEVASIKVDNPKKFK